MIRPPTPTPEPTLTPTPTHTPEVVILETATPVLSPSPEPTAVAMVVTEPAKTEKAGVNWGSVLGIGAMVAGLGLTVLAAVAIMYLWRNDK